MPSLETEVMVGATGQYALRPYEELHSRWPGEFARSLNRCIAEPNIEHMFDTADPGAGRAVAPANAIKRGRDDGSRVACEGLDRYGFELRPALIHRICFVRGDALLYTTRQRRAATAATLRY